MSAPTENGSPLLALDNITTYYGQMRILEGISLQVGAGELVCLLGGNASGKSTTLKTILGIVRPRRGRVLLDEPAAGMNPKETHEITELIGRLRDERGYTILVIEHDMHVVEGISDRVVALDHGEKLTEGSFHEVANHPQVIEAYLGRNPEALKK